MTENNKKFSRTLSYQAWQRLKKNKLAMGGLIVILIASLVATLGSIIRPDSTPMANEMSLQLTTKPPGFKVQMLKIKNNQLTEHQNNFQKMFFGGEDNEYKNTPIRGYRFSGENIIVQEYAGTMNTKGVEKSYNVADVAYSLSLVGTVENDGKGNLIFNSYTNERIVRPITDLQQEIVANNIVTKKFILDFQVYIVS